MLKISSRVLKVVVVVAAVVAVVVAVEGCMNCSLSAECTMPRTLVTTSPTRGLSPWLLVGTTRGEAAAAWAGCGAGDGVTKLDPFLPRR